MNHSLYEELYDEINQLLFGIDHPKQWRNPIHLQATYQNL